MLSTRSCHFSIVVVTVATVLVASTSLDETDRRDIHAMRKMHALGLRTLFMAVWPFILVYQLVPDARRDDPLMCFPVAWCLLMWLLDAVLLLYAPVATPNDSYVSIKLEATPLTGLAFGLCGLFAKTCGDAYRNLFLGAILGCFLVVLPTHNMEKSSLSAHAFHTIQKCALMACISSVILACVLSMTHTENVG